MLILNLILIPRIDSRADAYSAEASFSYTFGGYSYQFYYSGDTISPSNYTFHPDTLEYIIQKSGEGMNLSMSSGLSAKINFSDSPFLYLVYSFYRNFVLATSKLFNSWVDDSCLYGFKFTFTGSDSNYPDSHLFGTAYGFSFVGWAGEQIDLVLDSNGLPYGSSPIGNYTFSQEQSDLANWSSEQDDDGDILMPSVTSVSFSDLKAPYIIGKSMYFFPVINGVEHEYIIDDFVNVVMSGNFDYNDLQNFLFYKIDGSTSTVHLYENNQVIASSGTHNGASIYYQGPHKFNNNYIYYYGQFDLLGTVSLNYPAWYGPIQTGSGDLSYKTIYANNYIGLLNDVRQSGYGDIFLGQLTTSPLPDPIVLPVDDPIPVTDIEPDPIDFDPDPGTDPDPVPGIDYPVPGPTPVPVPPLPPLVSGNDDLWPDMNEVFEIESDMDSYLGGLSNFEFTPLRTLVEGFASSLMWVSTIMMALYNGSDFSVLFVVLSIFFIAAALLGIYKWWTH